MTARDDRFLDPDELADRYNDVRRPHTTAELDSEEWETVRERAEQSE